MFWKGPFNHIWKFASNFQNISKNIQIAKWYYYFLGSFSKFLVKIRWMQKVKNRQFRWKMQLRQFCKSFITCKSDLLVKWCVVRKLHTHHVISYFENRPIVMCISRTVFVHFWTFWGQLSEFLSILRHFEQFYGCFWNTFVSLLIH